MKKIYEYFGKSLAIFGKLLESFGHASKVIFILFNDFLKFSENLRKRSEIFGKLRKRFKGNFQMFLLF